MLDLFAAVVYYGICFPWIVTVNNNFFARGTKLDVFCRRVSGELRPFFLPAYMFSLAIWSRDDTSWVSFALRAVVLALWVCVWLIQDDDDDDPWRKRRKKLQAWVQSRLPAPVPQGA